MKIENNSGLLIGQGTKMLGGLVTYGTALRITQITPLTFKPVLDSYIDSDGAYIIARSNQQTAYDTFHTHEDVLAKWLLAASNVLAATFGNRWSTLWAQAGFINNTTAIPTRIEDRIALALNVIRYLTNNPSIEVPGLGITAAHGTEVRDATLAAQSALTAAGLDIKTKNDTRTNAQTALTELMRALTKILDPTLSKTDPRWEAFGLKIPAIKTTPGQPQNVRAHFDEAGNLVGQCDPLALATSFRWRIRVVGVDLDYRRAASSKAPLVSIGSVLPGQTIEMIVQGVNGNQQGVASEPIVIASTAKAVRPLIVEKPAAMDRDVLPHSNGVNRLSSNGATNGASH